jgi:hypothetical protein
MADLSPEIIEAARASILEEPPERAAFERLIALCAKHDVLLTVVTNVAMRQLMAEGILVRGPQ